MEWHLYRNGEQSGPISEEKIYRMGREGQLFDSDLVWNQDMSDWTPAGMVPGLIGHPADGRAEAPGPPNSKKQALLEEILSYDNAGPFRISRGNDTDLVITNEIADSSWFSGKKKVTYTAQILLKENEKTAYYWEMLKETSSGFSLQAGFKKSRIRGIQVFEQSREKGYAPGGEMVYDYQFDYGTMRDALKQLIGRHDWKFKLVLSKGKASY